MPPKQSNVIFSNPEKKPLEDLFLTVEEDGVNIKVPALNKRWAPRDAFTSYLPLVLSGGKFKTDADLDEWMYEANWFRIDMNFLLKLPHYQFWSYIIYQESAMNALNSFLKKATPFYIDMSSLPPEKNVPVVYADILSTVVRIICRIITNKESEEEWISKDKLKSLIYSNFLISIPMLFDLIIALGDTNTKILRRIFDTVFRIEPKYEHDLTIALQYLNATFDTIQTQAENEGVFGEDDDDNEHLETPYDDLVLFTVDSVFTLSVLLDVFPDARKICCKINLAQRLTCFYDTTIPFIYKNVYVINSNAMSLKWLNEIRVQILKTFRSIVNLHIEKVLEDPESSLMPCEEFIAIMTECLSDRAFVIDYQREYPIELDVDILKQACKDLDEFKTNFVAKGYKDEADSEATGTIEYLEKLLLDASKAKPSSSKSSMPKRPQPDGAAAEQVEYDDDKPSTSKAARSTTTANTTSNESKERDIDLEVTSVLDVLPHLGDGFIRRVLSRYDNSEEAISAILEQNLPPDLMHADQNEVYIPIDPQDILYHQTGIKRYNVFDGDKYDIMTQDNPDCIIKIGKGFPNAPQSLNEMLDDKTELNKIRDRYQQYTLVEEGNEGNEYDDEYDDSYEALLESESRAVRSKQIQTHLAEIEDRSDDEETEEEEGEDEQQDKQQQAYDTTSNNYDKRMNFCENPEDIRARYEARRAAKFGGHNTPKVPPPQVPRDVVGEAKGKGQSKEVTINRHKKDVHKSSRANHNRKAGAAFKRSKGMMG